MGVGTVSKRNDNKTDLSGRKLHNCLYLRWAGMLGLPAAGSGAWTFWSIVALVGSWS